MHDDKCPDCGGTDKVVQVYKPVRFAPKATPQDCPRCDGIDRVKASQIQIRTLPPRADGRAKLSIVLKMPVR